jgi:hypothetical protein
MNNKPITARIKSGMFKTKEPLLNVGPAGVDGNNKTRTMPSPSKMKGYAMKSSPFKQKNTERYDDDGNVIVGSEDTVMAAGDILKKEIMKKVKGDKVEKLAVPGTPEYDKWKAAVDADPSIEDRYKDKEVGTGEFEEVQGDPKEVKVKKEVKLKTKDKGDAQSAYNRRQNIRSSKVTGRQKKRQTIKEGRLKDKLAGIDKDKNPGKYRRIKAKLDQATDRLGVATSEAKNVANQSKQNIKAGSTKDVMSDDRYVTQGERTEDQQKKSGEIVKSAFTPKEVNTDIGFEARDVKSGFFKKKSPMKMNYFKK